MIEGRLIVGRYLNFKTPEKRNDGKVEDGFQRLALQTVYIKESKPDEPDLSFTAQWLEYISGLVTEVIQNYYDVLTGPMGGCWVTRYTRRGVKCVGHVGTHFEPDSENSIAAKGAWNKFRASLVTAVTGFEPSAAWEDKMLSMTTHDGMPTVYGLVTTNGEFYSVLILRRLGGFDERLIEGRILGI
jgi:hypothetical protein